MKDKPVLEKKNLDKGLKRSVGKPACCVSKGGVVVILLPYLT
ncbi:hypothetical protein [Wolbachia endosymbiont of Chrysomya megacephala]|nr:hypothetical protein [Wolbachia endosymbiont of Chrysomya megacephala]